MVARRAKRTSHWQEYEATDPQDDWLTWSIDGPDKDSLVYSYFSHIYFQGPVPRIWRTELTLLGTPLDYENPQDANEDGVYEISMHIADEDFVSSLPITVTVLDVNEAPLITGKAAVDFPEDSVEDVGTYSAADPEGGTSTLRMSGPDADGFSLSDGVIRFNNTPDHETKTCHAVTLTATDEADEAGEMRSSALDVTIAIVGENEEAPSTVTGLSVSSQARIRQDLRLG